MMTQATKQRAENLQLDKEEDGGRWLLTYVLDVSATLRLRIARAVVPGARMVDGSLRINGPAVQGNGATWIRRNALPVLSRSHRAMGHRPPQHKDQIVDRHVSQRRRVVQLADDFAPTRLRPVGEFRIVCRETPETLK